MFEGANFYLNYEEYFCWVMQFQQKSSKTTVNKKCLHY